MVNLPHMNRSEYPEVSYGIIEGTVCGAMGVKPLASESSVATCSRLAGDSQKAELKICLFLMDISLLSMEAG